MLQSQPVKTYRLTWDELMSHRSEIAPGAVLEVRVFSRKPRRRYPQRMPPPLPT